MKPFMIKKMILPVLLLFSGAISAGNDIQTNTLPVTASSNGSFIDVPGNRYASSLSTPIASRTYYTGSAYGLIKLSAPDLYKTALTGSASVTVKIDYKVEQAGGGGYIQYSVTQTLTLQADGAKVIDGAYYKAQGAEYIKATITSVTIPASWGAVAISLEASVSTESFDFLDFHAITAVNLIHQANLTSAGNLKVMWTPLTGAEGYELEWTYVSDQGAVRKDTLLPGAIEVDRFLFRNNSSRVDVTGNSYEIPLMYERGYILYRLRASGKRLANGVVVNNLTEWTAPDGFYGRVSEFPSPNIYLYQGMEKNLNWQSSLTFAEEGKHKAVLAYHDGSMRNRQALTRINTDERSVVGETFYDYNGKPVIQVLPVPVTSNSLTYYPNFNLIEGQTQLRKEDYSVMSQGSGCVAISPVLSTGSGASNYYSPQNNFTGSPTNNTGSEMINRDNVPNANKKPYTQTKYKGDNTGKIAAQSGVGDALQLNTGHETKYLYGTPQQEELTRLFGSQVGYNVHYKKDLTVDPNGQVSVTYKNLGDKVVATTLVGTPPNNLNPLDGAATKEINSDLLGANSSANPISKDGLSKNYLSTFSVPSDNKYSFDYSAILQSYDLSCINSTAPFHLSLDGVVDLSIQLIDGCGSVVFVQQQSTAAGNIGASQTMTVAKHEVPLKQGEYTLTKQLSINQPKLEQYWEDYLDSPNNCLKDSNDFINEEKAKLDLIGCDLTCEKCKVEQQKMLNDSSFSDEERANLLTLCDEICDKEVGCTTYIYSMLGDMSPGGQYGELRKSKLNMNQSQPQFDSNNQPVIQDAGVTFNQKDGMFDAGNTDDDVVDPSPFPLSIFNPGNSLPLPLYHGTPLLPVLPVNVVSWRQPLQINDPDFSADNSTNQVLLADNGLGNATYSITDYKDVNGAIVYAYIYRVGTSSAFNPSITDTTQITLVDKSTQLYKIPIRFLLNVADFEKYWQVQFANYLLPYHPEYGYLIDCSDNYRASNDFDYALSNTDNYTEAKSKLFLDNNDLPEIIRATKASSMDPFLQSNTRNYKYLKMRNNQYKQGNSMAQMATIGANCPRGNQDSYCGLSGVGCSDGIINTDAEWNLYKGMYISEKEQLIKQAATKKAVNNFYYNGCIGDAAFYTSPDAAYFRDEMDLGSTTITPHECHTAWSSPADFSWLCHDVTITVPAFLPAYIDSRQVCSSGRASLFKDKSKRFFVSAPSGSSAGQMPLNCEQIYQDSVAVEGSIDTIIVPIPCDTAIVEAMNQTVLEAERYKFESCGLCPLASDVESLVMDLKDNADLEHTSSVHITCPNDTVQLGQELFRRLVNLNTNNPDIFWRSTVTTNTTDHSKVLSGSFVSGTGAIIASLTLTIPPNSFPSYVEFNTLSKICCMSVNKSVTGPDAGKIISFEAAYYDAALKTKVNFTIYGRFDLRLDTCTITPRCMVTDDSRRVSNFISMLATSNADKNSELFTNGTNTPLLGVSDIHDDYYLDAVRALIKKDNDLVYGSYASDSLLTTYHPAWNSIVVGNVLQGTLTYKMEDNVTRQIVIELSGLQSTAYNQILEFSRVRPFSGDATKFYVDGLITSGTKPSDNVYVPLTIQTPSLKPTVCENPQAPVE